MEGTSGVQVTVVGAGGSSEVKEIVLLGHCVLCLRRTSKCGGEGDGGLSGQAKWARMGEREEIVPEAEFVANCDSGFLWTLNWTWNALRRKRRQGWSGDEKEEVFGGGAWTQSDLSGVTQFNSFPTMCQECGNKLMSMDRLLSQVVREIAVLRSTLEKLDTFGDFRYKLYNSVQDRWCFHETLEFFENFRNKAGLAGVSGERDGIKTDLNPEIVDVEDDNRALPDVECDAQNTARENIGESSKSPEFLKPEDCNSINDQVNEDLMELPTVAIKVETFSEKESCATVEGNSNNSFMESDNGEDPAFSFSPENSEIDSEEDEDFIPTSTSKRHQKKTKPQQKKAKRNRRCVDVTCNLCGKIVKSSHLLNHQRLFCSSIAEKPKTECDLCGISVMPQRLPLHKKLCKGKKTYKMKRVKCKYCDIVLTEDGIRRHRNRVHPEAPKGVVNPQRKCDLCKHISVWPSEHLEHLKGHVGEEYVIRCPTPDCMFTCITLKPIKDHLFYTSCAKIQPDFAKSIRKCAECGSSFNNLGSLRSHLLRNHETAEKNFPCPISGCQKRFSVRQSVVLHLGEHDVPREVDTQVCSKCTTGDESKKAKVKLEDMEAHLKEKHGVEELVKCRKCPFLFPSWDELVDHMFEHRYGELVCDICVDKRENFNRHVNLQEHYFTVHQIGKQFQCEQCPKSFFKLETLTIHVKMEHKTVQDEELVPKAKPTYQCDDCGIVFKSEVGLKGHNIREHGAEPFHCTFCTETFTTGSALMKHKRILHKCKGVETPFLCSEPNCGQVFQTYGRLIYHRSAVHSNRTFVCEQCGKEYRTAGELKRHHEVAHLGIRKWICDTCGEAFTGRSTLKRHNLIHTGERPFACDICGQRFRHKEVLKTHVKGHLEKGASFKPSGPMKQIRKRVNQQ